MTGSGGVLPPPKGYLEHPRGDRTGQAARCARRTGATIFNACLEDAILLRTSGDTLVVSPPLVLTEADIGRMFENIGRNVRLR